MTTSKWAPLSGIATVVLFTTSAGLGLSSHPHDSDAEIVTWWSDGGNRARVWTAAALLALAIVLFLSYASGLRETVRTAAGEGLAALAFSGAIVFAALTLVSDAAQLCIPAAIDFGKNFRLDPDTARLFDPLAYLPIFGGAMMLSLTVGATSVAARRSGLFPRWLAVSGYVVAPALLLSVVLWGIPLVAFGIWVVATSVVALRRPLQKTSEARPALAS